MTECTIRGVRIDIMTMDRAAETIAQRAIDKKQPPVYVCKPYVEFFDTRGDTERAHELLANSWLNLPDGVSTQWAAAYQNGKPSLIRAMRLGASIVFRPKAISKPIPEKFGGTAFAWKLLQAAANKNARIYLVGSPNTNTIEGAAAAIKKRLPEAKIVGTWPGKLGGMGGKELLKAIRTRPIEAALLTDIKDQKPDLILVGMGFPLQEEVMAKLAPQITHGVLVGEGGTFDYDSFGGKRRKAPRIIQKSGLEWLWRLVIEPKRFKRQLSIPRFIWQVYRDSQRPQ